VPIEKFKQLACPLDGLQLKLQGNMLKCPQGHSYDIARQGYVNLLPVQQKKSRDPGDSKEMVAARGRHLDNGFFEPVAYRLDELSLSFLGSGSSVTCVDAACGDGYYLDHFHQRLQQGNEAVKVSLTGLDISKWAIMAAAKRNRHITWVVGNSQHAPVMTHSVDMLWSVFGFSHLQGFRKMLNDTGRLVLVDAGPDHLIELREIIYPELRKTAACGSADVLGAGFRQIDAQSLSYRTLPLSRQQLADLLLMTPHLYRASHAGKQAVSRIDKLSLTVDVRYRVFTLQ
jgi:23S rRNA (guanine745-N1)-methyltransferase